jgi:hypothetical protein
MKFSDLWLPDPQHNPDVEEDTANFFRYLFKGMGDWMNQIPLERIETGKYQLPLSLSGDAVLYWKAYIHTLKGYPPRLWHSSDSHQWVGLFIESTEGFQVTSSKGGEAEFHNNYEAALSRYEQLKQDFLEGA